MSLRYDDVAPLYEAEWGRIVEIWKERGHDIGPMPRFALNRGIQQMGVCYFKSGTVPRIELSCYHPPARGALLDTIRHEIAHATAYLVDQHRGHGKIWRRHARIAGATTNRCITDMTGTTRPGPKATVSCGNPSCSVKRDYYRVPIRLKTQPIVGRCTECGWRGQFPITLHP